MKIEAIIERAEVAIADAKANGMLDIIGGPEDCHGDLDDLGELIAGGIADDDIAIYFDGDRITAVIDANGPCGVTFSAASMEVAR